MDTTEQQQKELIHQLLAEKIKEYHQPKPDDDIDLVTEVANIFVSHGLANKVSIFLSDPLINDSIGKVSHVQRFNLNRYFNKLLLTVETRSTLDDRYCLIPNGEISQWLELFRNKIIYTLIENDLPRSS